MSRRTLHVIRFLLFPAVALATHTNSQKLSQISELERLSFGSCNSQHAAQPLWRDMQLMSPDLFIWGGDNVYAETRDPAKIKAAYRLQDINQDYESLRRVTPIIGTWDDHDFAFDNATGTFLGKKESKEHLLDFLQEPLKSMRRERPGVYTSYQFGSEEKRVKIILLDNRYFKDLEPTAPLLGEAQWKWLEDELTDSAAKIHFIVGGLSILSPKLPKTDEWGDYPRELTRMLKLLGKCKPAGVVFLSGDKHFSSIFERHGHLEFMSSGMTHTAPRATWGYLSKQYPNTFFGLSYGLIDIAWEKSGQPILTMAIRTSQSRDVHRRQFRWVKGVWQRI